MNVRRKWRLLVLPAAGSMVWALSVGLPAAHAAAPAPQATGAGALVTVGSPADRHPENAQNEPALAVDPVNPNIVAAGANDLVDMQPCSQQAATTAAACSFPLGTFNLGVGLQGVYFSFDSGHSWVAAGAEAVLEVVRDRVDRPRLRRARLRRRAAAGRGQPLIGGLSPAMPAVE